MASTAQSQRERTESILLALQSLQGQIDALELARTEPVAIIGLSCRFPSAPDARSFWRILRDGVDAIREVPAERWDVDAFYDSDPEAPGKMYSRCGGFLDQLDHFDPDFFGISHREAVSLDPQQRLLLEVAWEALEEAGVAGERLSGSRTGVFLGLCTSDYFQLLIDRGTPSINAYVSTGTTHSVAAGRLSYQMGLVGPSVAVDTACSSSLVALHLACQSLRGGDCDMALVGGVNAILLPHPMIIFSKARMLAADGRCKSFDASADGFVRGEGCGVVVLKRLRNARRDGDRILALVRGTAVNQDGHSQGLTAPNGPSQQGVIRDALAFAGIEPREVGYVEAHGTGTALGDPIEVQALATALGAGRDPSQPLLIGSVKTNIGHLEAAAGIAGLIKVVLALQHQEIPPSLHFREPNPYIPWDQLPVRVVTRRTGWPAGQGLRIAGVSSFGYSGTNAHVILEEAPAAESETVTSTGPARPTHAERGVHVLALSAKSEEALRQLAGGYASWLEEHPDTSLADVCFSANTGRSHFEHRAALVAASVPEARVRLAALADGAETDVIRGQGRQSPRVAFLFTGQGSQYPGMARELHDTQPAFRRVLERCDEILRPYLERPLLGEIYPSSTQTSLLGETVYAEPALFAIEYALAELWRSWGIEPDAVLGHGVGQYVAACVAGVFSLEDGLRLIAERARLIQSSAREGAMVAVFAGPSQVEAAIRPYSRDVSIAAYNGPQNVVISGRKETVERVVASLEAARIKTKQLRASHAFHSALMDPILDTFERKAREVTFASPRITLVSNLDEGLISAEYWRRHAREPVRFAEGVKALHENGCTVFVELGPKPTLLEMARQCLDGEKLGWLPSLRQGQSDERQMLESLGALYVRGARVDWSGFDRDSCRCRISLPTYPFQRERFWLDSPEEGRRGTMPRGEQSESAHPLLGERLRLAGTDEVRFESRISHKSPTFLHDHRIFDAVVLPATVYLEMALAAGVGVLGTDGLVLEDVVFEQAMVLPDDGTYTLQTILTPRGSGSFSFQIFSQTHERNGEDVGWKHLVSGRLFAAESDLLPSSLGDIDAFRTSAREVSPADLYSQCRRLGIAWGPDFQALTSVWVHAADAIARIRLPETLLLTSTPYKLHPVMLDAAFQVVAAITAEEGGDQIVYLPVAIDRVQWFRPAEGDVWSRARMRAVDDAARKSWAVDLRLLTSGGQVAASVEGLQIRAASREAMLRSTQVHPQDWLVEPTWRNQELSSTERSIRLVSVLKDLAAGVLECPAGRLDVRQPLSEIGLDSLMAVELRNRVRATFAVDLPVVKFMEDLSVAGLAELVDKDLETHVQGKEGRDTKESEIDTTRGIDAYAPELLLAQLDQFSDEEVSALLNSTTTRDS